MPGLINDWLNGEEEPVKPAQPSVPSVLDAGDGIVSNWLEQASDDPTPAINSALDKNPDEAAANQRTARDTGLPVEAVEADPAQAKRAARSSAVQSLLSDAPATSAFLARPENASVAHDDVESLTAFERLTRGFERGQLLHAQGRAGVDLRDSRSPDAQARVDEIRSRLNQLGHDGEGVVGWFSQASEVLGQIVATMQAPEAAPRAAAGATIGGAAGAAGGPGAPLTVPAGALIGLGAGLTSHYAIDSMEVEGGNAYLEMLEKGIEPEIAQWASVGVGVLNSALEVGGAAVVVKPFTKATKSLMKLGVNEAMQTAPVREAIKQFSFAYGGGIAAEVSTEIMQEAVQITAEEIAKDFSGNDLQNATREEIVERLSEIAVKTFQAMTVLALPGPGVNFAIDASKARKAEATQEQLDGLRENVEQSALAKRDPEKAAQHHATALAQAGVREVFVSADALEEVAAATGDPAAFYAQLGVSEQTAEANVLGGDIRLTGEQFSQHILQTDLYDKLAEHIRMSTSDMTAAEAKEFRDTGAKEALDRAVAEQDAAQAEEATADPFAGDEAVATAADQLGLQALFRTAKDAGLSDKQYTSYLEAVARAADGTLKRQEAKRLKQEKRALTEQWKTERAKVYEGQREHISQEPVYAAIQGIGRDRLDREAVAVLLPDGAKQLSSLPKQKNGRAIFTDASDARGVHPDTVAQAYGFDDGQIMLFAMMDAVPFEQAVNEATDKKMMELHGDINQRVQGVQEALRSLHHDNHAEVLAFELNQLSDARKGKRLKAAVVRQAAREKIGDTKISDITADKFLAAERRSAQKAGKFVRAGDRASAAKEKFRQLVNFQLAKEAFDARDKVDSRQKYLRKFLKDSKKLKNIPAEYLKTIRSILGDYEFGPKLSSKKRAKLEAFVASKAAQGVAISVPQRLLDADNLQNYQDLTLNDFTALYETVKELHHQGLQENKMLLESETRTRQEIVDTIRAEIQTNLAARGRVVETRTATEARKRFGREAVALLLNADTILREIDGFKPLGPAYTALKGGYDRAFTEGYHEGQVGYARRQQAEAKALNRLFSVYSKKERIGFSKKVSIPGVGVPMTRGGMISVMLNSGNADNLAAMIEGGQFTEEEVTAIHNFASKKDWEFVQSVWDYLDGFWDEVVTATERRRGFVPERVEAAPVATPHGTFRGGYYPLRYDNRQSIVVNPEDTDSLLKDARFGRFVSSHTRRHHTEQRVGAGGRKVLLDMSVLNSHVDQVIYDLEVGDAITDLYKVLHHKDLKEAFAAQGHLEKWDSLDLLLGDIVTGEMRLGGVVEHSLRWLRTGFTVSKLAWNVGTMLLQPLGVIQSSVLIGKRAMFDGVLATATGKQFGPDSIYKFVAEQSGFMAQREDSFNKDIIDASRQLSHSLVAKYTPGRSAEIVTMSFFYGIKKFQRLVDTATWLGAKKQGLALFGGDNAKATTYADRMVARSQASGNFGERTALERGTLSNKIRQTEMVRTWTPLISYFMAKTNVAYERTKRTNFRNPGEVVGLASDLVLLYLVEAMLVGAIRGQWPDEDDDETLAQYAGKEALNSVMAGVPILREFVSEAQGFRGGGVMGNAIDMFAKAEKQISQGEVDAALLKSINNMGGMLLHYPSSQINKTGEAIMQHMEGEEVDAIEFLMGPKFDK